MSMLSVGADRDDSPLGARALINAQHSGAGRIVLSAIQHVVPPTMRATASAIFLFINNLIGIGLGTVALGIISDNLEARFGDDSLKYAILGGTGFYLIAATLFLLSARHLAKDWEE